MHGAGCRWGTGPAGWRGSRQAGAAGMTATAAAGGAGPCLHPGPPHAAAAPRAPIGGSAGGPAPGRAG